MRIITATFHDDFENAEILSNVEIEPRALILCDGEGSVMFITATNAGTAIFTILTEHELADLLEEVREHRKQHLN